MTTVQLPKKESRSSRFKYVPFYVLIAGLFAWGAIAEYANLYGSGQYTASTNFVPWGLWVAAYMYFIGLSAGAFLLSSMLYGLNVKILKPVGRFALFTAIACLAMALLTIASDVGQPSRATYIYVFGRPNSMMAWMVWLYTAYFLVLLGELFLAFRVEFHDWMDESSFLKRTLARIVLLGKKDEPAATQTRDAKILKTLALIGIPLAIAFHGGVGSLLATVATQAIWHNPLMPIYFVTGALFSGGALLTGLIVFFWPRRDSAWKELTLYLGKVMMVMGMIYALMEWAEFSIPLWYGYGDVREASSLHEILYGQYWYVFWIFQVLLVTLIPIALYWFGRKSPKVIGIASFMTAICFLAVRLDIVIPAYVAVQIQGLVFPALGPNYSYSYFPNLFEWQLLAFVVAIGMGLLLLGYRILPLIDNKDKIKAENQ
ncbi:MAG: NrfD/PsrC family molybdoenzyme membrane anchor subunit [Nitrososphaerales archaeon]|jgi:molybdopterin-containing oxidoreductase family membrane subunit